MAYDVEQAVRELRDRAAIQDVLLRYAHAVDRRDLEAVAACFAPDAVYSGGLGTGDIRMALDALRDRMQRYVRTMHLIGNQLIEVKGDRATSETYAIAYHQVLETEERRNMAVGVRYLDELERRGDGWIIRRRKVELEWQRTDDVILPLDR